MPGTVPPLSPADGPPLDPAPDSPARLADPDGTPRARGRAGGLLLVAAVLMLGLSYLTALFATPSDGTAVLGNPPFSTSGMGIRVVVLDHTRSSLRGDADLSQLAAHLLDVVDETMQPAAISLWLNQAPPTPINPLVTPLPDHRPPATAPRRSGEGAL